MSSTRCIVNMLDSYQKAKMTFLQYLYDYTLKKDYNVNHLAELNIVDQIVPLLSDSPNVRSLALTTTVKLCLSSECIAKEILEKNVICACVGGEFESQTKESRRNILSIVRNISKHPELTAEVLRQGEHLILAGIKDLDLVQRELALAALTNIANYSECTAQEVMALDILPQLILCLQCTENLSLEAMQLVRALSKQSLAITIELVEAKIVKHLADHLNTNDGRHIKLALQCFIDIARYSKDFARTILDIQQILCKTILYMSHCDSQIRRFAVMLIKELCKYSADISRSMVQKGALPGLIQAVENRNNTGARLPAALALGYIGAQCNKLALAIIHCQGLNELISAVHKEANEPCLKVIIWAIEKITEHSAQHVSYLNDKNVFARLLRIYLATSTCPELKAQCHSTLEKTVSKCLSIQDIEFLLYDAPMEILPLAIKQLIKILSTDPKARRIFVSIGGLERIQALKSPPGSELAEDIVTLNALFPDDIVRYYSNRISDKLMAQIERFNPESCPQKEFRSFPSRRCTLKVISPSRSQPNFYHELFPSSTRVQEVTSSHVISHSEESVVSREESAMAPSPALATAGD